MDLLQCHKVSFSVFVEKTSLVLEFWCQPACSSRPVTDKVDAISRNVEQDQYIRTYHLAEELSSKVVKIPRIGVRNF